MLRGWVWRADIFQWVLLKVRAPRVPSLLSHTPLLAIEVGPGQAVGVVVVGAETGSQQRTWLSVALHDPSGDTPTRHAEPCSVS